MRVTNDPGGPQGAAGAFSELFRLQSDFQARLAEETLRYLRRLQGAVVPAAPGTVVLPTEGMSLQGLAEPGGTAELMLEIENLQRVHCMVTPQLTPLVSAAGVTWFPAADTTTSRLLAPGAAERVPLRFAVPAELPPGEYRGALLLQGFRKNSIGVVVVIAGPTASKSAPVPASKSAAKKATKTAATKTAKTAGTKTAKTAANSSAKKARKSAAKKATKSAAKKASKSTSKSAAKPASKSSSRSASGTSKRVVKKGESGRGS